MVSQYNTISIHCLSFVDVNIFDQSQALKQQDQYNKENYRLTTLRNELDIRKREQAGLQSKEMELLVREELLMAKVR